MCDQICVIEVPKISTQESVQVVKLSLKSEFRRGCVNRSGLLKCSRIQARRVSRQSKFVLQERISEKV